MSLRGSLAASWAPSLTHILLNGRIILYSRQLCILAFQATTFMVLSGRGIVQAVEALPFHHTPADSAPNICNVNPADSPPLLIQW
jgi:hypothetical protein